MRIRGYVQHSTSSRWHAFVEHWTITDRQWCLSDGITHTITSSSSTSSRHGRVGSRRTERHILKTNKYSSKLTNAGCSKEHANFVSVQVDFRWNYLLVCCQPNSTTHTPLWGTGIRGLMTGMATLPQGNQWSKTKLEDPQFSKSVECDIFPSVLWRCWLDDRKGIRPVKSWVLVR